MRSPRRHGALAAVAVAVLVAAGSVPAAHTFPKLLVRDRSASVTIEIVNDGLDDPAAGFTVFVPRSYGPSFPRPGATIGAASARVTAPDLGLAQIELDGTIEARTGADTYSRDGVHVALADAAQECTGTAAHAGFWVVTLRGTGRALELPLFVDASTPETAPFASATLRACLPPPDVPVGTPGRAPLGSEVARLALRLDSVLARPSGGLHRWRMTEIEYVPGRGVPNPRDMAETQSLVHLDRLIVLDRPRVVTTDGVARLELRARSTIAGTVDAAYRLFRGASARSLRSSVELESRDGTLRATLLLRQTARRRPIYLQARATVETLGLGPASCRPTFAVLDVPCVYATRPGFTAMSPIVRVVVPPRAPSGR
jgi:hypothetical protein